MKALLLGSLLLWALPVSAAIDIDRLAKLTADIEQREGRFVQEKYLASVDASLHSSGSYSFLRGRSLRWRIEKPVSSEVTVTADGTVSSHDPGGAALLSAADNPVGAALGKMLFAILTADWTQLAEFFEIDGTLSTARWQVELRPRDPALAAMFSHIELRGERFPTEILLHETGGNRTRIRLE